MTEHPFAFLSSALATVAGGGIAQTLGGYGWVPFVAAVASGVLWYALCVGAARIWRAIASTPARESGE